VQRLIGQRQDIVRPERGAERLEQQRMVDDPGRRGGEQRARALLEFCCDGSGSCQQL
jgi:hypothetical protein